MPTAKIPLMSLQMESIGMGTLSFDFTHAKAILHEAVIKKWSCTMIYGKRK